MSTKAQQFRADAVRTHAAKKPARHPPKVIDPMHTDTRNVTVRGDKKVGMALEDSFSTNGKSPRPSRVSTRKSAHHGRADVAQMRTARAKTFSPKARATRAQAQRRR
ncbi:MAG: hypothetical protein U0228_05440 [Myxococcaceae bacterium]